MQQGFGLIQRRSAAVGVASAAWQQKQNKTGRNFWSYVFETYLKLLHCVSLFTKSSQPGGNFKKRNYYMYPDVFLYKCDITQKMQLIFSILPVKWQTFSYSSGGNVISCLFYIKIDAISTLIFEPVWKSVQCPLSPIGPNLAADRLEQLELKSYKKKL